MKGKWSYKFSLATCFNSVLVTLTFFLIETVFVTDLNSSFKNKQQKKQIRSLSSKLSCYLWRDEISVAQWSDVLFRFGFTPGVPYSLIHTHTHIQTDLNTIKMKFWKPQKLFCRLSIKSAVSKGLRFVMDRKLNAQLFVFQDIHLLENNQL